MSVEVPDLEVYLAFSASSHATTLVVSTFFRSCSKSTAVQSLELILETLVLFWSSLAALAVMLALPRCSPKARISWRAFDCTWSFPVVGVPTDSIWLLFPASALKLRSGVALCELVGLFSGVVALTGVAVREGSTDAVGVIAVPMSLIDTALLVLTAREEISLAESSSANVEQENRNPRIRSNCTTGSSNSHSKPWFLI